MLGERLRAARKAAGFRSQEDLAKTLEVSRETVQRAETGDTVPRGETLLAWARACKVSLEELTGDTETTTEDERKGQSLVGGAVPR